eukprot:990230-Amorphochlora_amoeboformis.AAC.1
MSYPGPPNAETPLVFFESPVHSTPTHPNLLTLAFQYTPSRHAYLLPRYAHLLHRHHFQPQFQVVWSCDAHLSPRVGTTLLIADGNHCGVAVVVLPRLGL